MKLLCDVHLPKSLVKFLTENGIEAIHGSEILDGWRTKDSDFCNYADKNNFTMVTKDGDFRNSHFIQGTPKKLIKINLGNISNKKLISLFKENLPYIIAGLKREKVMIEINADSLSVLGG
jgi:predicted nuclease of predicted toxin-antitoxin system